MKRKRSCHDAQGGRPTKRHVETPATQGLHVPKVPAALPTIHHNVLSSHYHKVCTLRSFLLSKLPVTSRVRRKRLDAHGKEDATCILDTCLVGVSREPSTSLSRCRKDDFTSFTQTQYSATGAFSGKTLRYSMKEVRHRFHFCCNFRTTRSN
jgi:hypothetical protein